VCGVAVKVYRSHELTYAGGLIQCKHCNAIVTGESVVKKTTGKEYVYYRCSQYNAPGHPRVRLNEEKIDLQMLAIFDKMRIESDDVREWFAKQLRSQTVQDQQVNRERRAEMNRQLSLVIQHHNQLVNMRLNEEINSDTYAAKSTELRDREAKLKLQLDACDLGRHETAEIAVKAFELSQNLRGQWVTADYSAKRRYLEIVFLNFVLDDVTLVPTTRKPFDVLAEGLLVSSSREYRI
jgi:site-specific DNA recombinase